MAKAQVCGDVDVFIKINVMITEEQVQPIDAVKRYKHIVQITQHVWRVRNHSSVRDC